MRKSLITAAIAAAITTPLTFPAQATLIADGISYDLTATSTADPLTEMFTFTISGQNSASDTEGGGRTGINAIAFSWPTTGTVSTGVMTAPPSGFAFVSGGLNANGCDASGNFYCFDNLAIPPTPGTLLPTTPIVFEFSVTLSSGDWSGYFDANTTNDDTDPHMKIDWVGTKNNYDLVSLGIDVGGDSGRPPSAIPEPATPLMLGLGLLGLAFTRKFRHGSSGE